MDQILTFIKDYWLLLVIGLIVIIFISSFLKAIFRIGIFLLALAVILVFGFNYTPQEVIDLGKNALHTASEMFQETIKPVIEKEFEEADIQFFDDGTYLIKTDSLRIKGEKGEPTAQLHFKDKRFSIDISEIEKIIGQKIEDLK